MGDGTKENPYTREDVIKRIDEMKNQFDWVDLSGGEFKYKIDLRGINLHSFILKNTNLSGANLEGVDLSFAKLECANLSFANLKGANFDFAHLEGADLFSVELSSETKLADVKWVNHVLDEKPKWRLGQIENGYRRLKQWYTAAGLYEIAGKFFYREMEARRKNLKWKKNPFLKLWNWTLRLICGYGEKPERVIIWAASVILSLALVYFSIGSDWEWSAFSRSLYFSTVSFTALGYGSWVSEPVGWVKAIGALESFIGVFSMALFLVTFTRKMTR